MAWVRLIEDYETHKAGEVVDLPAVVARNLIHNGKGVGGRVFDHKTYEKAQVSYESRAGKTTVIPSKLKPLDGTRKEMMRWLDGQGIDYPSNARKSELIEIVENA